ncbi:PEFG-CTERM sorting domain-containing protein [Candidatus Nitrosopumilus salaria]|uniref:PEFG-CTERM sorting domain-containing protein n=1 Tax=Candidatus Nitrosopumilus salarius TaxID=1170320 RepID=UPI001EE66B49|nr:PEFG-CTERM sorting domain-containing protein [Candidatus Nitrosopumilus salaria]
MFLLSSFSVDVYAQEVIVPSPLSLGSNHLGSMIKMETVSDDGSTWILVTSTEPVEREHMTINVRFTDKNGQELTDLNYDILVTQNGQVVLDETMVNQQIGIRDHLTNALPSNDNVNIKITLQGIGTNIPLTGPHGESLEINVVPEFGTIAMMILIVSIMSIVAISAKSKLSLKL